MKLTDSDAELRRFLFVCGALATAALSYALLMSYAEAAPVAPPTPTVADAKLALDKWNALLTDAEAFWASVQPFVLWGTFFAAHGAAMVPGLAKTGKLGTIINLIAGNYGAAKNAG